MGRGGMGRGGMKGESDMLMWCYEGQGRSCPWAAAPAAARRTSSPGFRSSARRRPPNPSRHRFTSSNEPGWMELRVLPRLPCATNTLVFMVDTPDCFVDSLIMNDTNAIGAPELLDDFPLDILGQQERINRLYTQITLCFLLSGDFPDPKEQHNEICTILEQGLARLAVAFPWIAGRVKREPDGFKIRPPEAESPARVNLIYKEGSHVFQTWEEFQRDSFPFSMLDEDRVAPCKTLVRAGDELPVLLVQANFIRGGLLLTINAQHGSMDMRGQGQIIYWLAKACRGETFTAEEIEVGNMPRRDIIPLFEGEQQMTEGDVSLEEEQCHGKDENKAHLPVNPSVPTLTPALVTIWAYFAFPATSLAGLKSLATETVPPDTFVSTDDALTAFTWQAITRARKTRLQQGSPPPATTLTRNVDVRRHFGLPSTYPGLVTAATSHTCPVEELASRDLGHIASGLRAALEPDALVRSTRARATDISRDGDAAGKRSIAAMSNPSLDVRLSSWAKEDIYGLSFGPLLGRPEVVRRPRFVDGAREGLVYFLPKDRDGEIVVGVCLRDEDLERLKRDEEIRKWSRWIG